MKLDDLFQHLEWAESTLWNAVLRTEATRDASTAERLYHIHTVQHAFLRLWRGEPLELPEPGDFAGLEPLARWGREGHRALLAFLEDARAADLEKTLEVPWTQRLEERLGRPAQPARVRESALQVALHSAHHRGQVATRLRELGGEPPLIDYLAWVWQGRPPASWPATVERAPA